MENQKIRTSIVVISYNTKDLLRKCLKSLQSSMRVDLDELIVIDNASDDGTVDMLRKEFPDLVLEASEQNKGFAHACNRGLSLSRGQYVLFANGDLVFPEDAVQLMVERMDRDEKIGILSPELLGNMGELAQMSWGWKMSFIGEMRQKVFSPKNVARFPFIQKWVKRMQRKERHVPLVAGACMMTRRCVMDDLKGLDEKFELYFEDADLCLRCWKNGYSVIFFPKAKVFHGLGQSGVSQPTKIILVYRQSQVYFYRKHNSKFELRLLKIYLWSKFFLTKLFWSDKQFRYWIGIILGEEKRFLLSAPFSEGER